MAITIEASEKDIEDVLCQNMDHYLGLRFVGRQIHTPAGIVDILARSPCGHYYIIELKKGPVDAGAYAQVMRYCHFFNYNKSRNGKRTFVPLLIGDALASDMIKNVVVFERSGEGYLSHILVPEYTLYNFNPLSGISFSYYSPSQKEYADENFFNQRNYIEYQYDEFMYESYNLHRQLEDLKKEQKQGAE